MAEKTAIELIEQNARLHPDATAITYREGEIWHSLSWETFWCEIARTANGLKSLGLKENDCACIYSQNSKDWIIFDLAVQIAGGIAVPIYATSTFDQAMFIIEETESNFLFCGSANQTTIVTSIRNEIQRPEYILTSHKSEEENHNIHELSAWNKKFSENFEFKTPDTEETATIIYTSGTTGTPKGVVLTHGNFSSVIKAHKLRFKLNNMHGTRSLAFLPLSHVFEREWSLFVLSQGGEVIVLDNPKDILETLKKQKPTALCAVPRLYEKIYQSINSTINNSGPLKKRILKSALSVGIQFSEKKRTGAKIPVTLKLKHDFFNRVAYKKIRTEFGDNLNFLPVGGAMIKKEISEFMEAIGMPIIVGYGLTETSATVTCYPEKNYVHGSAGKPLPDIEIKIGADDEILVKSNGVMKGYYKNPEETKNVFTNDGFFKTGDCGRIDEEGNLYITDRIKDLMKTSNGKYIAPQPIEISLLTSPEIVQAMIIADERPFVTSLIVPDLEILSKQHPNLESFQKLSEEEQHSLLNSEGIRERFQKIIEEIQKKHSPFEKIKRFKLLPKEFTIENGELTPTLKIKRSVVLAKLKPIIDAMYDHNR